MPDVVGNLSWPWHLGPALFTVLAWWGATGLIAWLIGKSQSSYRLTLIASSIVAIISLGVIVLFANESTAPSAWLSFSAALGLWGWIEVTFLTGTITGPHRPRPTPRAGFAHARDAIRAILWHELVIIATIALCAWLTSSAANRTALFTLLLLWIMRSSAKLNLFLGVRNLGEVFLPRHLQHLLGFLRHRQMNLLFPFSLILGSALTWQLTVIAIQATDIFVATSFSMLATLSALAMLEHMLMVLPIPAEALWRWSLRNRDDNRRTLAVPAEASECSAQGVKS